MASDRIQRRIERLLDQIEQEADQQNWQRALDLAKEVLRFAPDNADAKTFIAVAEETPYFTSVVPDSLVVNRKVPFATGPSVNSIAKTDPRISEVEGTIHMDFGNYTVGRLFQDRRNYDMDHVGHQSAIAHVLVHQPLEIDG